MRTQVSASGRYQRVYLDRRRPSALAGVTDRHLGATLLSAYGRHLLTGVLEPGVIAAMEPVTDRHRGAIGFSNSGLNATSCARSLLSGRC